MEEDIKKCEEFINLSFLYGKLSFTKTQLYEYQKAIASLLNRLEQDERVIEKMAEYISDLDIDEDICKKRTEDCYADVYIENACKECVIDHFRKKCE